MAFNEEQSKYISELYSLSDGKPKIASDLYAQRFSQYVSPDFFRQRWRKEGYMSAEKRGGRRHGLSDEDVHRLHNKHDGDLEKIAAETGLTIKSIALRCAKLELDYRKPKQERKPKLDLRLFDRFHRPYGSKH